MVEAAVINFRSGLSKKRETGSCNVDLPYWNMAAFVKMLLIRLNEVADQM